VIISDRTRLPVEPMLGVVGITPAAGRMDTRRPAETGGNMDCRDVRAGTTVVFTAQVPGVLAGFGDAHALQGDGRLPAKGLRRTPRSSCVSGFFRRSSPRAPSS
jgi:amidase